MTIYIDLLIFENFIFNLFIFYITFKMLNFKLNMYRLIFSSFISSLVCLLIVFNLNSTFYLFFVILLSFLVNTFLCIPKYTIRCFFQVSIIVLIFSFLLFGIISFFNDNFHNLNYIQILIIFLLIFVISSISKKYIKNNTFFNNYIFDITLKYEGKIYNFKGFLDTGNELCETVTKLPVIIVERRCIPGIFFNEKYFYKIPYKVITGTTSYFEGIRVTNVHFKSGTYDFYKDVILCTTQTCLDSEKRFDAILSRCII